MTDNTVLNAATGMMTCKICGDAVPVPCGCVQWVAAVMKAFSKAHAGHGQHSAFRTTLRQHLHATDKTMSLLYSAMSEDSKDHKQWYLWRILQELNPTAYTERLAVMGGEDGITP